MYYVRKKGFFHKIPKAYEKTCEYILFHNDNTCMYLIYSISF